MVIIHLSDLHVSRYGSILTHMRGAPKKPDEEPGWTTVREDHGWRVEVHRVPQAGLFRRDRIRLIDELGMVHRQIRLAPKSSDGEKAALADLERLLRQHRHSSAPTLAKHFPTAEHAAELLAADPDNANLRFCMLVHALRTEPPDWLVITGDLTDDGEGYELLLAGLAPFIERGRLVVIPGNHDIYPSPLFLVKRSERKTLEHKRKAWSEFATKLGQPGEGSWVKDLGDGVVLACFDSCHPPRIPASASGMVPEADLESVANELAIRDGVTVRLGCVHHHIVNPPINSIGMAPFQPGMRLRNAKHVYQVLKGLRFHVVMNGHRHVGYRFHPPHAPLFLSAPSSTVGCRSGAKPFYWRIEVERRGVTRVEEVPVQALGHLAVGTRRG